VKVDVHQMLSEKEVANLDQVAQQAIADAEVLREIVDGVVSKDETFRYNCFKVLIQVCEAAPGALYPEWDTFVELLGSSNAFHRGLAIQIIARLTRADTEQRFDDVFDRFFDVLDDDKVMVSRYLVQSAGQIVQSKPYLRERVTARLLTVDETRHTESRKDLIKADIVQVLGESFKELEDKERIVAFVEQQLESSSPKARKAAKEFLKAHVID